MASQILYYSLHCKAEEAIKVYKNFLNIAGNTKPMSVPVKLEGISQNNLGIALIFSLTLNSRKSNHHYNLDTIKNLAEISQTMYNYFPAFHSPPLDNEKSAAEKFIIINELPEPFTETKTTVAVGTEAKYQLIENTLNIVGIR